ncbi:MAG: glutamate--tRNA ligase [Candidatus Paceibacter sp.]|nr:glutamate--tRNA ligase [Candidatus Paceibacter sp.]
MDYSGKIISRFAPTPTGTFQLGIIRNALYVFLLTKKTKGKFILRVDDTDPRSKKKNEKYIIDSLIWLGLNPDEIYRQSERKHIYRRYIEKLIKNGSAYITNKDEDKKTLIRFKNCGGKVKYFDQIRGEIVSDVSYFGDFVIARSMNDPTYHLASVVDDYEMGINYVLRGEDHIPNTPKHIMIATALGIKPPKYCHLPLLLGPDRTKLSLRKEQGMNILDFKKAGYLPEAILNFVALSGWSPKKNMRPIFSKKELLRFFSIKGLQKANAIFDITKLDWFNKQHIRKMSLVEKFKISKSFLPKKYKTKNCVFLKKLLVFLFNRINNFSDINKMTKEGQIKYFFERPKCHFEEEINISDIKTLVTILKEIPDKNFEKTFIYSKLKDLNKSNSIIHPLEQMRRILSGRLISFDPVSISSIIGKKETLYRLNNCIKKYVVL